MSDTPPDPLNQEFEVLMRRAGLTVPPERHAATLAGFKELRTHLALLRQTASTAPRTAAAEPSNVFALRPLVRS